MYTVDILILALLAIFSTVLVLLFKFARKRDTFRYLIEPELKKHNLNFVSSVNPGPFSSGPFRKFSIIVGKPQINIGTVEYEFTNYRKVTATKQNGTIVRLWAKIESGPFKQGSVEFDPPLEEIK